MTSSSESKTKKRMGRPPTGRMPQTVLKLPRQTLDGIDKLATEQKVTRAEIMRQLLAEALEARRKHR
jgi:metal-responsive CopG/Arc/MetJ family transcriptional regulator